MTEAQTTTSASPHSTFLTPTLLLYYTELHCGFQKASNSLTSFLQPERWSTIFIWSTIFSTIFRSHLEDLLSVVLPDSLGLDKGTGPLMCIHRPLSLFPLTTFMVLKLPVCLQSNTVSSLKVRTISWLQQNPKCLHSVCCMISPSITERGSSGFQHTITPCLIRSGSCLASVAYPLPCSWPRIWEIYVLLLYLKTSLPGMSFLLLTHLAKF